MAAPGSGGPFYFAWTDATDTTFSAAHYVCDEDIFSFSLTQEEGYFARLELTVRNPRIGLLAPSRNQWAWFAVYDEGTDSVIPLFYGRLVGIPSDILAEVVTLQFIARSNDWIARKQTLADSLKVRPYYDPIYLDDKSRSDPDAIIEGYSAAYHCHPQTHAWTISDIVQGEDGTLSIPASAIIDESVRLSIKDVPQKAIRITASVDWKQAYPPSSIFVGAWVIDTYTGGKLISDWPKPGASLGGGWYAADGTFAVDVWNIENAGSYSESGSFSDTNRKHQEGDVISANWSAQIPLANGIVTNYNVENNYALIGGGAQDTSASAKATWSVIAKWRVACQLALTYNPQEVPFYENIVSTVYADIQDIFTDPDVSEETETIEFNAVSVSSPIVDYKAWTSCKGNAVSRGQVMLPNVQVGPGGLSFQICVTAGTCGTTAPAFSDVVGETTSDGSATWACVGGNLPTIDAWKASTYVTRGTVIAYANTAPGSFQMCVTAGVTGAVIPLFSPIAGGATADGTAIWVSLGTGGPSISIPVGGSPGYVTLQNFFPSDRGQRAIEYMLQRARAKIITRARAIEISAQVPLSYASSLSLRKSATLNYPHIPGGQATGKIIEYSITGDGDSGEFSCEFTICCTVGKGGSITPASGTPTYCSASYVGRTYQVFTGSVVAIGAGDIAYTPPAPGTFWNGWRFPITADQAIISAAWVPEQVTTGAPPGNFAVSGAPQNSIAAARIEQRAKDSSQQVAKTKYPAKYFEMSLRSIDGTEVSTRYVVETQPLVIPAGIDLSAPSNA